MKGICASSWTITKNIQTQFHKVLVLALDGEVWLNSRSLNKECTHSTYLFGVDYFQLTFIRKFETACEGKWVSVFEAPVFQIGGPSLIPLQFMWDLWWAKWHPGRFLCEFVGFPLLAFIPPVLYINTFAASYLNTQGLNNSCLKSPASTLVELTFQSRTLRSFSLNQLRNLSL